MNEEELDNRLEKDVAYLQRNIAPDDIYLFTQNALLANYLLAYEFMKLVGAENYYKLPKITRNCIRNISYFKHHQENDIEIEIDLNTNGLDK